MTSSLSFVSFCIKNISNPDVSMMSNYFYAIGEISIFSSRTNDSSFCVMTYFMIVVCLFSFSTLPVANLIHVLDSSSYAYFSSYLPWTLYILPDFKVLIQKSIWFSSTLILLPLQAFYLIPSKISATSSPFDLWTICFTFFLNL